MTAGTSKDGVLAPALLVTLASPSTWPLALATFLLRGGIAIVALPILVLPTPVGIGNAIGPALTAIAFGSFPTQIVVVLAAIVVVVLVWLVAGGWLAAFVEAEEVRIVVDDEEVALHESAAMARRSRPSSRRRIAGRILVARLVAALPLAVVLAVASVRLVLVTYRELTAPIDVTTPILLRVLRASPEVVVAIVLAWTVAEIVGSLAARRIAQTDAGIGVALRRVLAMWRRQPISTLVRFVVPTLVLLLVLALAALAAAATFDAVAGVLYGGPDPVGTVLAVAALVAVWAIGLLLTGVVCAWRAAVWTVATVMPARDIRVVPEPPTGSLVH
ncbi:MAG: hypothetical protein ABI553_01425 [Chloroflexota bacterium]